eukprot:1263420-Karenia_brevis.AAC.1
MCAIFEGSAGHECIHRPPPMVDEWDRSYPRGPFINHSLAEPDYVAGFPIFANNSFGDDSLLDGMMDVG